MSQLLPSLWKARLTIDRIFDISLINRRRFKIRSLNDQKETQNETSCVGKRFGKSEQSKYNTQDLSGNAKGKVERIYSCVE